MINIIQSILVAALLITSVGIQAQANDETPDVTCKEALANVGKVKIGMSAGQVVKLLGKPTGVKDNIWGYNFFDCAPPPRVGDQTVIGVAVIFNDEYVFKLDYATICATGPGK